VTGWPSTGWRRETASWPWPNVDSTSTNNLTQDAAKQEDQAQLEWRRPYATSLGCLAAHPPKRPCPLRRTGSSTFIQQKEDWEFIAGLVSGSSWQKCKFRWLSLKKVRLVTHKWSKAESRLLA
jgi:hypothetical protein